MTAVASMDDVLNGPAAFTKWDGMDRRQRAFAGWLLLQVNWPQVYVFNLPALASYDRVSDMVKVTKDPERGLRSHATWAWCRWDEAETLKQIEAHYGAEARDQVLAVVDADAVPRRSER